MQGGCGGHCAVGGARHFQERRGWKVRAELTPGSSGGFAVRIRTPARAWGFDLEAALAWVIDAPERSGLEG